LAARPEAQLNPLLIFLLRVMCESDVKLLLNFRIIAMMLYVTEQRFVAGMAAESIGKLMAGGQIDAQLAKSFEQFRIVRIEQMGFIFHLLQFYKQIKPISFY